MGGGGRFQIIVVIIVVQGGGDFGPFEVHAIILPTVIFLFSTDWVFDDWLNSWTTVRWI